MIMDITIHNLFINEENPCNEWEQNRREKWNQAVKDPICFFVPPATL